MPQTGLRRTEKETKTKILTTMDMKEKVLLALRDLGYKPEEDEDGDLGFRYQMKKFFVHVEEDSYVFLFYPGICSVDKEDVSKMLLVCNAMNRSYKLVRLALDSSLQHVSAMQDFYFTDDENLKSNLEKSIESLGLLRTALLRQMEELEE